MRQESLRSTAWPLYYFHYTSQRLRQLTYCIKRMLQLYEGIIQKVVLPHFKLSSDTVIYIMYVQEINVGYELMIKKGNSLCCRCNGTPGWTSPAVIDFNEVDYALKTKNPEYKTEKIAKSDQN